MDPSQQLKNSKKSIMRVSHQRKDARKPRGTVSCTSCRRRKLKCNRLSPCSQCLILNIADSCTYPGVSVSSRGPTSTRSAHNIPDSASDATEERVYEPLIEDSTLALNDFSNQSDILTDYVQASANFPALFNPPPSRSPPRVQSTQFAYRGKNDRTRFFGRSHWAVTLDMFSDLKIHLQRYNEAKTKSPNPTFTEYLSMKRLKQDIRKRKIDQGSHSYTPRLEDLLPSRALANYLVDLYISTFETTFRILPTQFLSEYRAFWNSGKRHPRDSNNDAFIAKLLALMTCSSAFADQSMASETTNGQPLNANARDWIREVVSWAGSMTGYARLSLDVIQVKCLLLLARQAIGFEGDLAWMSAGSLMREAISMGLHRDPSNFARVSVYWAEIRRRLWLTIIELDLQSALQNGTPMGVSWEETDCALPSNFDDGDMTVDSVDVPPSKPMQTVTRTSFQLVLAQTLRVRMNIAKAVSNVRSELDYKEVLSLSDMLTASLANGRPEIISTSHAGYSPFQKSLYLFLIYRCLLALHRPYFLGLAETRNPTFEYSRKLCVQSSMAILAQLDSPGDQPNSEHNTYPYLLRLKGGMFRDDIFHAAATICFELCLQAKDDHLPTFPGSRHPLNSSAGYHPQTLLDSVNNTIKYFEFKVRTEKQGCKAFMFLHMIMNSARAQNPHLKKYVDESFTLDDACPHASRRCRELLLADSGSSEGRTRRHRSQHTDNPTNEPLSEREAMQLMEGLGQMTTPISMGDSAPELSDPGLDWTTWLHSFDPESMGDWSLIDPLM